MLGELIYLSCFVHLAFSNSLISILENKYCVIIVNCFEISSSFHSSISNPSEEGFLGSFGGDDL